MNEYFAYNDYELIYLLKEGIWKSREILYKKCLADVYCFYRFFRNYYTLEDFNQEALLEFEKILNCFDVNKDVPLFKYFNYCFRRACFKEIHLKKLKLKDRIVNYSDFDVFGKEFKRDAFWVVKKYTETCDDLEKNLIEECLLGGMSVALFCRRHNLDYSQTHYKFHKLKVILQKILTN